MWGEREVGEAGPQAACLLRGAAEEDGKGVAVGGQVGYAEGGVEGEGVGGAEVVVCWRLNVDG